MGWNIKKSLKKAFQGNNYVSWVTTGGSSLIGDALGIKESKYLDPLGGLIGDALNKPDKAPPPPTPPEPPEEAKEQKKALRILNAKEQEQMRRKLLQKYGGTLATSPLGIPGQAHLIRPMLMGR